LPTESKYIFNLTTFKCTEFFSLGQYELSQFRYEINLFSSALCISIEIIFVSCTYQISIPQNILVTGSVGSAGIDDIPFANNAFPGYVKFVTNESN
jgi:hypothetical protein